MVETLGEETDLDSQKEHVIWLQTQIDDEYIQLNDDLINATTESNDASTSSSNTQEEGPTGNEET